MLKREFFEAHRHELMALSKLSYGFTGRMKERLGKEFTNRFFKSDYPTDENVEAVLDATIADFMEELPLLERKKQLVETYQSQTRRHYFDEGDLIQV
jgi:hypothetical protein